MTHPFRYLFLLFLGFSVSACGRGAAEHKDMAHATDTLIEYAPVLVTEQLPNEVQEQSGIVWFNGLFWVNNDSHSTSELFAYDEKGKIHQKVLVTNVRNRDWEDLADDSNFIYIGDFGNNRGGRKDLSIFRIRKSEIPQTGNGKLEADAIRFAFADQKKFTNRMHGHNYDCEALFALGDSLYVFSKDWEDHKTRLYVLPKTPGDYNVEPRGTFDTGFMVTGADISSDGKTIALVGYKNFSSWMMIFSDYQETDFFNGKNIKLELKSLGAAQTEGLVFGKNDEIYINCEKYTTPHALYRVEWEQWKGFFNK